MPHLAVKAKAFHSVDWSIQVLELIGSCDFVYNQQQIMSECISLRFSYNAGIKPTNYAFDVGMYVGGDRMGN